MLECPPCHHISMLLIAALLHLIISVLLHGASCLRALPYVLQPLSGDNVVCPWLLPRFPLKYLVLQA